MPARVMEDILNEQGGQGDASSQQHLGASSATTGSWTPSYQMSEDVVISGISGRLPESDNIEEFRQHLVLGEDMVTEDNRRWEPGDVLTISISV